MYKPNIVDNTHTHTSRHTQSTNTEYTRKFNQILRFNKIKISLPPYATFITFIQYLSSSSIFFFFFLLENTFQKATMQSL